MAKKQPDTIAKIPTVPSWETRAKRPFTDGRWPGTDNSLWLWRAVPMSSVTDARSPEHMVNVGRPLANAWEEMARLAGRGSNRRQVRATYRDTHALLVNIPRPYEAPIDHPLRDYLNRNYANLVVMDRSLLFGVKLRDSPGGRGWREALDSFTETLVHGTTPLEDYDQDVEVVSAALARCGFRVPTSREMRLADSWWNSGGARGIPVMTHEEHIHYFTTAASARRAEATNPDDCSSWGEIDGEFAITFASVEDFDLR